MDNLRRTERYSDLVDYLAEQEGHRYGWKAAVARKLGVHASYISKIAAGEVQVVGVDITRRACDLLGLDPRYFADEELRAPGVEAYLGGATHWGASDIEEATLAANEAWWVAALDVLVRAYTASAGDEEGAYEDLARFVLRSPLIGLAQRLLDYEPKGHLMPPEVYQAEKLSKGRELGAVVEQLAMALDNEGARRRGEGAGHHVPIALDARRADPPSKDALDEYLGELRRELPARWSTPKNDSGLT